MTTAGMIILMGKIMDIPTTMIKRRTTLITVVAIIMEVVITAAALT